MEAETIDVRIEKLKQVLFSIRQNTQPVDGHTDPKSINDCWDSVGEILCEVESSAKLNIFITWRASKEGFINYDELTLKLGTNNLKYLVKDNNKKNIEDINNSICSQGQQKN